MHTPPASANASASQRGFPFIFLTVLLDILALGIVIPVLPGLIKSMSNGDMTKAVQMTGLFSVTWSCMQFLFSPLLGLLSDRFGRRSIILLSNVGLGLDYLLMAAAPNLTWLFIGRIIAGITAASMATAHAYVADITPPEQRAQRFGMLGGAFGLGFILGPGIGGMLSTFGLRTPFYVAACFSLLNAFYGWLILPESLPPERRLRTPLRQANPLAPLKLFGSANNLWPFVAILLLNHLAHQVLPSIFVLYSDHRYGWHERLVGISLMIMGCCSAIVQMVLIGKMTKWIGERSCIILGLLSGATGFVLYGWAPRGWLLWLGIPAIAAWGLAGPSIMAIMSRSVRKDEQGLLQGSNSSLMGIAGMIGPLLFSSCFAWALHQPAWLIGLPFWLSAALLLCSLAVFMIVAQLPGSNTKNHTTPNNQPPAT